MRRPPPEAAASPPQRRTVVLARAASARRLAFVSMTYSCFALTHLCLHLNSPFAIWLPLPVRGRGSPARQSPAPDAWAGDCRRATQTVSHWPEVVRETSRHIAGTSP